MNIYFHLGTLLGYSMFSISFRVVTMWVGFLSDGFNGLTSGLK